MGTVEGIIIDVKSKAAFLGTVYFKNGVITKIKKAGLAQLLSSRSPQHLPCILPGFIDSHIHLDMTFVSPSEYAKIALSQGVIGAAVDCHDIASVLGKKGVLSLIENAGKTPFYFSFAAPADIVPGVYEYSDIDDLLKMKQVTHLGEMKDFPSLILHDVNARKVLDLAKKYGKKVDGHAPGVTEDNLREYCDSPVSTDHESRSYQEGLEKIRHGLILQIQTRDSVDFLSMKNLIDQYPDKTMLCTEIVFAQNIRSTGYLNKACASLIESGCDVFNVLAAACVNPAEHYGIKCGFLREGDSADFVIADGIEKLNILKTYIKGECVFDSTGKDSAELGTFLLKEQAKEAAKKITVEDLAVKCAQEEARLNVIDAMDDELNTIKSVFTVKTKNGFIESDVERDILKVALISRLGGFRPAVAFVHGFGIKRGAFAVSIGHDRHDYTVVGADDEDMAVAVNRIVELKGGLVYALDGKVICELELAFGGLISTMTGDELSKEYKVTQDIVRNELECTIKHPIRTLSYLSDTTIPTLKLSDRGLFSVPEQEAIPLF